MNKSWSKFTVSFILFTTLQSMVRPGSAEDVHAKDVHAKDVHAKDVHAQSAIERDPLAWLKGDITCDRVTDQIKARYAPLGPYSAFPKRKKEEVDRMLKIVCSKRFSQCHFKPCLKVKQTWGGGVVQITRLSDKKIENMKRQAAMDAWERANSRLKTFYEKRVKERNEIMSKTIAKEGKLHIVWGKLILQQETRPVKKRKKEKYPTYNRYDRYHGGSTSRNKSRY